VAAVGVIAGSDMIPITLCVYVCVQLRATGQVWKATTRRRKVTREAGHDDGGKCTS
jgi:hypothetical protein